MKVIIRQLLYDALDKLGLDKPLEINISFNKGRNHGDFSTNLPLVLANSSNLTAKEIAKLIIKAEISHPYIEKVELADAGFINFFIKPEAFKLGLIKILAGFDEPKREFLAKDNNFEFILYSYARICGLFRQLEAQKIEFDEKCFASCSLEMEPIDLEFLKLINQYPDVQSKPQQLEYYLRALAKSLHSYYNAITLLCEDRILATNRICLLKGVGKILKNGLQLFGVATPESM